MIRHLGIRFATRLGAVALLTLATVAPLHQAAAQDALGGGRGAAIGAVIGAGTGAVIGAEGERRRSGYYSYRNGCYLQRGDGAWVRVHPRYCY